MSVLWNCLAYFNSCVNPIIYNHASKEFRDAFLEVARCGRAQPVTEDTAAFSGGHVIALADNDDDTGRQGRVVNVTSC